MSEEQLIQTPCVFGENGNFLLERELGRGGMGGVYLGRDKMLDRPVAVKVMLKEYGSDTEFVERFKKEAQAAARLIHPNIAQIYSYGIADGMPYIAMELVAGGSLDQIMRNSGANSDIPRVMKICEQVAQALRCASDQGLVHGDIKPENILLDANGNAKIVDFGLAAMQHDTDEIWGTPYYIAPEKVRKEVVDYRADMYSLGGTLYHALCGVAPFEGDDASTVVRKRFEFLPRKPSEVRSDLSPQIDALVMKMLAFNPTDRYPSFEALLADFKAVMTVGLSASQILKPIGSPSQTGKVSTTATGKKKLTLKPKKKISLKSPSTTTQVDEFDENGEAPEVKRTGKTYKFKTKSDDTGSSSADYDDYEDEEGGNVGGKVALFIGGVIGIILLVAGGLWFVTTQNERSNAAKGEAAIRKQIDVDLEALNKIRVEAEKSVKDVDEVAKSILENTEEVTKKLKGLFSNTELSGFFTDIVPPKNSELLAAEAALNPPAPEPAVPAGQAAATQGATQAPQAAGQANAPAAAKPAPRRLTEAEKKARIEAEIAAGKRFPLPVGDQADPMSPEGQDYLAAKKKWEEAQKAKAEAEAKAPAQDAPAQDSQAPAAAEEIKAPRCVGDMQKHWNTTYTIQANALKAKKKLLDILDEINAGISGVEYNESVRSRLMTLASSSKSLLDGVNTETRELKTEAKKHKNTLERFFKDVRSDVVRKQQEKAAKERAELKKQRDAERAQAAKEAYENLLKEEMEKAKAAFETLVANGTLRRLYWEGAERDLKALAESFQTQEARRRIFDVELKKVQMMKSVQDIFIANMKAGGGYVFGTTLYKNKFLNKRVVTVDADEIVLINKNGKGMKSTIRWQTVYSDYPLIMNELWNKYIVKGRENGVKKLTLMEWADAQLGFAMTLKLICSNVEGAEAAYRLCVTEAVKKLPNYKQIAVETFPEVDLSAIEAEAAANDL